MHLQRNLPENTRSSIGVKDLKTMEALFDTIETDKQS
jgi:hypothetical protein